MARRSPGSPASAVPPYLRPVAAGHEAAHAVVGILVGYRIVRATIDLSEAERARLDVSALVTPKLPPDDWPISLSPHAHLDHVAAGYAWEVHTGCVFFGAWERAAHDRHLIGDGAVFVEAAEAVRARWFTHPVMAAIDATAGRLVAGTDLDEAALMSIMAEHGLTATVSRDACRAPDRSPDPSPSLLSSLPPALGGPSHDQ